MTGEVIIILNEVFDAMKKLIKKWLKKTDEKLEKKSKCCCCKDK